MIAELVTQWRERAELLRPYAEPAAKALDEAADELERALNAGATEALNLQEAARESGYSAEYLGRLVRAGRIPNVGRPNAPRIRRCDLPRKATHVAGTGTDGQVSSIREQYLQSKGRR